MELAQASSQYYLALTPLDPSIGLNGKHGETDRRTPTKTPCCSDVQFITESQSRSRPTQAFTLVELMAVIGVIALIAVVGVPAIKGLTGSGGRKQALAQVLGALEVARNTAIATGTNAAVIFPNSSSDSILGGENNPYRYRSMAVVAWNPTNTNPPIMVGPWITLPQGIAFFPQCLGSSNLPSTNATVRILTTSNTGNFPAITFQPSGGLLETQFNSQGKLPTNGVVFFEGTVTGTTENLTYKNSTNFETVRITPYTGRAIPMLAPAYK